MLSCWINVVWLFLYVSIFQWFVLILKNETLPVDSSPKSTSVATASANRSEILIYLNNLHFIIIKILLSHFMTCRELTFQDVFVMFHWLNYKLLSICSCFLHLKDYCWSNAPISILAYMALWKFICVLLIVSYMIVFLKINVQFAEPSLV